MEDRLSSLTAHVASVERDKTNESQTVEELQRQLTAQKKQLASDQATWKASMACLEKEKLALDGKYQEVCCVFWP